MEEWLGTDPDPTEIALVLATAALEGCTYLNVADAAVALHRELGNSAPLTPRYVRRLATERSWIEWPPSGDPQVLRFRHDGLRQSVLLRTWFELDGARPKLLDWLTDLADDADIEVRARAAGAAGVLATADFDHALHSYLVPWASASSAALRQSAGLGLNVAGTLGVDTEVVWRHIEQWADQRTSTVTTRRLAGTAALAACGPLGAADPRRALGIVHTLIRKAGWWGLTPAAIGAGMLVVQGQAGPVLEALLRWSEPAVEEEPAARALAVFAYIADRLDPETRLPVLLDAVTDHPDAIPELWGRALFCEPVRDLAIRALRRWVTAAGKYPVVASALLDILGGIADRSVLDYENLLDLLQGWAQSTNDPSESAADFHDALLEAGEMSA